MKSPFEKGVDSFKAGEPCPFPIRSELWEDRLKGMGWESAFRNHAPQPINPALNQQQGSEGET